MIRGGDVRVMGLVNPFHKVEDIRINVAYRTTVIIPAEKAAVSKDLWRSISQRCLFQLPSAGPPIPKAGQTAASVQDTQAIQHRLASLEDRNAKLATESQLLRAQLAKSQERQQSTLEAILTQLKDRVVYAQAGNGAAGAAELLEVADGAAPNFIPEVIRPEEAETRINTHQEEAVSDVSSVADKLKKMRQGQ